MSELTKKALAASLEKLLEKKALDKITIKDITESCGVNRNTFYYHFQDIYDLLDWMLRSKTKAGINISKDTQWKETLLTATDYLYKHREMFYHVYYSVSRERLEEYLYQLMDTLVLDIVEERLKGTGREYSEEEKAFIADFYKYAIVGVILKWVSSNMKEDSQVLAEKLHMVFTLPVGEIN